MFVILAILAIFVTQSFWIAASLRPFLAISLSKSRIWLNFIVKFTIFVTAQSFHMARKIFVTFANFADFSKPVLTFSLSKSRILLNILF